MVFVERDNYEEYKTNLFVKGAMGCVTAEDESNIYDTNIPLSAVRERFERETVEFWNDSATNPETGETIIDESVSKIVRASDKHVFGKRGSDVPERQYDYLVDLAAGITGESPGDLHVKAAGTTRSGGRAYVQISTDNVLKVAGMEYEPYIMFGMSHDQSLAITSVTGTNVVVCSNMVSALFGKQAVRKAKTRQTKNATDELIITRHSIMLQLEQQADEFDKAIQELSETVVTDKQIDAFLDEIAPLDIDSQNMQTRNESFRAEFKVMANQDERASEWYGTKLGMVQALNSLDIWNRGTRKNSDPLTRMYDETLDQTRFKREGNTLALIDKVMATV